MILNIKMGKKLQKAKNENIEVLIRTTLTLDWYKKAVKFSLMDVEK
jgi:hypothetical protein